MKYNLYVIYDTVAKESGFPFDAKNDAVALRKFQSFLAKIKADAECDTFSDIEFELKKVAEYDSETCTCNGVATVTVDSLEV